MTELAQLKWFGHVVRMGMRNIPKWPRTPKRRGRDTQEDPDRPGKKGCRRY